MDGDGQNTNPLRHSHSHNFFGRSRELNTIIEYILNFALDTNNNAIQIIHITGPPAIGKTRLAKQVLHEIDDESMQRTLSMLNGLPFRSYFIDLQKESKMANVLQLIGSECDCSGSHRRGRKLIRSLATRNHPNTCVEILVLDGIDDLLLAEEAGAELLVFCQDIVSETTDRFKLFLILTSAVRFQLPRFQTKYHVVSLSPLTIGEAKNGLLGITNHENYFQYLDDLAEYSAGFPIAVLLIGTLIKVGHVSPKELTNKLRQDWIAALVNGDSESLMQRVRNVFRVCLESLPLSLRKNYAELVYIPASFTAETVRFMTSTTQTPGTRSSAFVKHDIILPLYDRSLIEVYHLLDPTSQRERFHVHQILRSFVEDRYHLLEHELHEIRNRYCVFYGKLLLKISPMLETDFATHLPIFTIEIRNIEKLLREAIHCLEDNTALFLAVAYDSRMFIETFLPTVEAVEFYKACVNAASGETLRRGRNGKLSEARMLLVYGKMLGAAKTDFELEYEQYMKCMRLLKQLGDSIEMPALLYSIAGNFHSRGKRFEAIKKLQEALTVLDRLETLKPRKAATRSPFTTDRQLPHQGFPRSCNNQDVESGTNLAIWRIRTNATYMLGVIYAWIGRTKKAEKYHLDSLEMKRKLWGENHPSVGVGYNGLSLVYEKLGDPHKAAHFCFLGLDIKQKFFKEPTTGVIVSLNNSARHLSQQKGQHGRALELLDKAYKMREQLGLNHRDTSLIYQNRGKVYTWMSDWKNAAINLEQAVELRKKYIGAHASTASSMHLLGKSYLNDNRHHRAVESLTECLQMREAVHMTEQPFSDERANTLEPLAEAYCGIGNAHRAFEFYDRTIVELKRLADGHKVQGDGDKASKFIDRIEAIQQKLDKLKNEHHVDMRKAKTVFGVSLRLVCFLVVSFLMVLWLWYKFGFLYFYL